MDITAELRKKAPNGHSHPVEDWVELANGDLSNSWVYYDGGGSTYNTPAYCKDTNGFVHLKGLIKDGTMQTAAFTLPVGYRPAKNNIIATASNSAYGQFYIQSSGAVLPYIGNNAWVSLDSITFKAA